MGAPIAKYLAQALEDFERSLMAEKNVDPKTIKHVYMKGAETFALFLTGTKVKRDQRTKGYSQSNSRRLASLDRSDLRCHRARVRSRR